jgi:hypothetical protein
MVHPVVMTLESKVACSRDCVNLPKVLTRVARLLADYLQRASWVWTAWGTSSAQGDPKAKKYRETGDGVTGARFRPYLERQPPWGGDTFCRDLSAKKEAAISRYRYKDASQGDSADGKALLAKVLGAGR